MKKILINIADREYSEKINSEYLTNYEELYKKHNILTYNFYKWKNIGNKKYEKILEWKWIYLFNYTNLGDLINKVIEIQKDNKIIYVNTFTELLIDTVTEVKIALWEKISLNKNIFRNKDIQRKLLIDYNPDITVKFLEKTIEEIDLKEIENFIWYPFILKPANWIQSAWVAKIKNKNDFKEYIKWYREFIKKFNNKWYNANTILIEEYIDWEMYSIDYFISQEWETIIAKPVKVVLWTDLWINDFFNYSRIVSEWVEKEFENKNLKKFVLNTIKATWIKNTFIHHEFKINSKWELKTIELNWRIWWFRPWIYTRWYWINLFEYILWIDEKNKLISNDAVINIYSEKRWILEWFNKKIVDKIKLLESTFFSNFIEKNIWKEVWLTKDWFWRISVIKLNNKNYKKFIKDYNFIKEESWNLTILK